MRRRSTFYTWRIRRSLALRTQGPKGKMARVARRPQDASWGYTVTKSFRTDIWAASYRSAGGISLRAREYVPASNGPQYGQVSGHFDGRVD
jgi:hypothetical protein